MLALRRIGALGALGRTFRTTPLVRHRAAPGSSERPDARVGAAFRLGTETEEAHDHSHEEEHSHGPEGEDETEEYVDMFNTETGEWGGPRGLEPTRFGDWERKGRCSDFA